MKHMIIRNALLAGSRQGELSDIYIEDGIISRISPAGETDNGSSQSTGFDAGGRVTIPGMIDPHVHLRTPGMEEKEDWISGSPCSPCRRGYNPDRYAQHKACYRNACGA